MFAPDVRAADIDGRAAALAGGYAGRIIDNVLIVGGGGYWLTNRDDDFKMGYGGGVVEWLIRSDRKIGFGVRTLVGGGSATLPRTVAELYGDHLIRASTRGSRSAIRGIDPTATIPVSDDFFIAEPQLNVLWNLSRRYRISFGVGYRAVAWAPLLGDDLNGPSGSVSIQFGGR